MELIPFAVIALLFWLLLIRPQRRRQLELLSTQRSLAVGDRVLLGAGIVGTVAGLPDDGEFLELDLAAGVRVTVARGAVARVLDRAMSAVPVDPDLPPAGSTGPTP